MQYRKIRIDFGIIPQILVEHINNELFGASQLSSTYGHFHPKIHGNATWSNQMGRQLCQINFESSDEPKLMKLIQRYCGNIVDVDIKLNQRQIQETNLSNRETQNHIELIDEIIPKNAFISKLGNNNIW